MIHTKFLLTCKCDEVIVKALNGTTKIRSKILIVKGNQTFAVCKKCGAEVRVPLLLDYVTLQKAVQSNPKLLLWDKKDLLPENS